MTSKIDVVLIILFRLFFCLSGPEFPGLAFDPSTFLHVLQNFHCIDFISNILFSFSSSGAHLYLKIDHFFPLQTSEFPFSICVLVAGSVLKVI